LLTYGRLPPALRALDYDGGHWGLVTGYENDLFFVHDPLRTAEEGGYQVWDAESLAQAMRDTSAGNLPHQGLVVRKVYPPLPVEEPKTAVLRRQETAEELHHKVAQLTARLEIAEEENIVFKHYLWRIYKQLDISEQAGIAEAQERALAKVLSLKL